MLLVAGFSAFAVFLGIASIGFLVLVVSFLSGELFDHGDLAGHDADFHGDVHGGAGVSIFSSRILSVFVTAFGGFGAIGIHLGHSIEVSTAMGVAGGLVFGTIIYLFASFLLQPTGVQRSPGERSGREYGTGQREHSESRRRTSPVHAGRECGGEDCPVAGRGTRFPSIPW